MNERIIWAIANGNNAQSPNVMFATRSAARVYIAANGTSEWYAYAVQLYNVEDVCRMMERERGIYKLDAAE